MSYDLDGLERECNSLGIDCSRVEPNQLDVLVSADCTLQFSNQPEESDTRVGFAGTPWHSHDQLMLMTSDSTFIECSEFEMIRLLASGDLVIVSQFLKGELGDRWLAHKSERLDIGNIEAGEELHIKRMASPCRSGV